MTTTERRRAHRRKATRHASRHRIPLPVRRLSGTIELAESLATGSRQHLRETHVLRCDSGAIIVAREVTGPDRAQYAYAEILRPPVKD